MEGISSKRIISDVELLGLRTDKNGSALWTIPSPEKRLNASMKNRIEVSKLTMYKNILDKRAFRSKFLIEKVVLAILSINAAKGKVCGKSFLKNQNSHKRFSDEIFHSCTFFIHFWLNKEIIINK